MEEKNLEHEQIIDGIKKQMHVVLKNSEQAIYIYLDDSHKLCNEKFSSLLGYESPEDWASVTESFPTAFVAKESQEKLVGAYQKAMEEMIGSQVEITWKKKNGSEVKTKVILVPISYKDQLLALHFVEEIKS
jgi:PAS domain S-box-containing protein